MKLAHIQPVRHLYIESDIQMLLPEAFIHPDKRVNQAYTLWAKSLGGYKILDNGAFEGDQIPNEALLGLAAVFKVDEVVAPDVMGSCDLTVRKVKDFFDWIDPAVAATYNWMGVAHGKTVAEVMYCVAQLAETGSLTTLGLPRLLNVEDRYFRLKVLEQLFGRGYDAFFKAGVHLLGCNWVGEIELAKEFPVRSMDTSAGATLTLNSLTVRDGMSAFDLRRPDNFWMSTYATADLAELNFEMLEELAHGQ